MRRHHIGGNLKIRTAGKTFTGGNVAGEIDAANEGAAILGYEELVDRMVKAKAPTPSMSRAATTTSVTRSS